MYPFGFILLPSPFNMPAATHFSSDSAYQASESTSLKSEMFVRSFKANSLEKTAAASARVISPSGLNLLFPMPFNIPLSLHSSMASSAQCPSVSSNDLALTVIANDRSMPRIKHRHNSFLFILELLLIFCLKGKCTFVQLLFSI